MDEDYIQEYWLKFENENRDRTPFDENKLPELSRAARDRDLEKATSLISQGADLNEKCYDLTPLHYAILNYCDEIAIILISKGANINEKSDIGDNCLTMAADYECVEIMKTLISEGLDYQESMDHYEKMGRNC